MHFDSQLAFSDAQSIAAAAGDVASTNIYDVGAAADVGIGEQVELRVRTVAAVTSGGAATVQFVLQTADDAAFGTNLTEFPLTAALALAALTANTLQYRGKLPRGLRRYLRVVYRIGTATTTAGSASAHIVKDGQDQQTLPSAFTV